MGKTVGCKVPDEVIKILDKHARKTPGIKNRSDMIRRILLDFVKSNGAGKQTTKKIEHDFEKTMEWRGLHTK